MAQRLNAVCEQLGHSAPQPAPAPPAAASTAARGPPSTAGTLFSYDTLICGGRVYDPANGQAGAESDVAVADGVIVAVAPHGELDRASARRVYEVHADRWLHCHHLLQHCIPPPLHGPNVQQTP